MIAAPLMISRTPTLAEWPYRMVRLACDYCPRAGQYRKETLIARFGGNATLRTRRCGANLSLGRVGWPLRRRSALVSRQARNLRRVLLSLGRRRGPRGGTVLVTGLSGDSHARISSGHRHLPGFAGLRHS
jgi:hypothetical protein